jgi:hypothetical protein
MNVAQLTQEFAALGYRVEITEAPGITGCIFKPTPKAKWLAEKRVYGFRFKTMDQCLDSLEAELNRYKKNIAAKASRKEETKIRNAEEAAKVQVGDIFHSGWGFEQTNVDFYQVVEKPSKSTVVLKKIGYETVNTVSWASENVCPVKDSFLSDETITKRLSGNWIRFTSYKIASKINPETDKKFYHSWYA